jgi:hypothetical protein
VTTFPEARTAIAALIRTAWLADTTTQNIPLLWDDRDADLPTSEFGRVTIRHLITETDTIGRFGKDQHQGQITVQVFARDDDSYTRVSVIAQAVKQFFHGATTSGVRITQASCIELPFSGPFAQVNVTAQFRYEESRG